MTSPSSGMTGTVAAPLRPDDPRELGSYRLVGRLGQGGMGAVYLATAPDGTWVAIKVIRPDLAENAEFRSRFRRETESARKVRRFATAAVLDADPDGERPYLVTEYVEGPTVARLVAGRGPLRPADLEHLAISVATALTAIHGAGIIHRDLTPSNVLLSPVGPKVIDFGLSRAAEVMSDVSHQHGAIGTPGYMAPEQIMGADISSAVDVFAWGGVIVYAGTGRAPFGGGPTDAVLYRVVHDAPRLDGLGELQGLVERAMAKDPADRPSAEQLRLELVGGAPAAAVPGPAPGPGPAPDEIRGRRRLFGGGRRAAETPVTAPAPQTVQAPTSTATGAPEGTAAPGGTAATAQTAAAPRPSIPASPSPSPSPAPPSPPPASAPFAGPPPASSFQPRGASRSQTPPTVISRPPISASPPPIPPPASSTITPDAMAQPPEPSRRVGSSPARSKVVIALVAVCVLIAAAVIGIGLAVRSHENTPSRPDASRQLAQRALAIRATNPDLAASLALAAYHLDQGATAREAVLDTVAARSGISLPGPAGAVRQISLDRAGQILLAVDQNGGLRAYSIADPAHPRTLGTAPGADALGAAVSPDGTVVASGGADQVLRLWRLAEGQLRPAGTVTGNTSPINRVVFAPNGKTVAAVGDDSTVRLWNVADPDRPGAAAIVIGAGGPITDIAYRPDSDMIAVGATDSDIRLWDITSPARPRLIATLSGPMPADSVAFSPDSQSLATGFDDGSVRLWPLRDPAHPGAPIVLRGHSDRVTALAFAANSSLISAGMDGRVVAWPGGGGAASSASSALTPWSGPATTVAADAAGRAIAAGGQGGAKIWSADAALAAREACQLHPDLKLTDAQWRHYVAGIAPENSCGS